MLSTTFSETISINECNLYYELHGEGFPLLLLHGFTGSGKDLNQIFDQLKGKYQLIIPDLRGHGKSTNPTKVFTHRQAAADILILLKYLKVDHCSAVGFSAGGNILLHMATQSPDKILTMTLISATPYFPEVARECMRQFNIADRTEVEWDAMRKIHIQGDNQIRMLWEQARAFNESYDDMNLTPSLLSEIKAKTLIVQGDRDPFYPLEISVEMYRNISHSFLWIVPGGGHVPFSPDSIQAFLNYLINFMSS